MLPVFPKFEPLSLSHRNEIAKLISKFPPYSDFNFVSLYSWNINELMLLSSLNNNLVIQFKDYTSDKRFLSFIGDTKPDETARSLLDYAAQTDLHHELHLVPEHVVKSFKQPELFSIREDRDDHDYIVLALDFSELKGNKYSSKRHGINKFLSSIPKPVSVKNVTINADASRQITDIFHKWRQTSGKTEAETEDELQAITRLLKDAHHFDLQVLGIYVDDIMVAFSIYEVDGLYAIGHFEKALRRYPGLYDYLKHQTALKLHGKGVKYINYEQDLGIEGLRKTKLLLHPERFLKKYTIGLR